MIKEIATNPFTFLWPVEQEGYEWAKGIMDSELHLVGRGGIDSEIHWKAPLRKSGLFREFAGLAPNQEEILEFATQHGDLFEEHPVEHWTESRCGASFERWKIEIGDMHAHVCIWEAIQDRDREVLKTIIKWNPNGSVRYEIKTPKGHGRALLASPDFHEAQLNRFRPGDVLSPAKYALQAEINQRIAHPKYLSMDQSAAIVPRLVWCPGEIPDDGTPPKPDHHQRIIFEPTNLLAAMWLQFAQATTGEYQLKRCQGCGDYFQAGPGGKRANAETCGDKCRQRRQRQNRKAESRKTETGAGRLPGSKRARKEERKAFKS